MTFFTSVTASEPKPVPKLHLFLVCKPKEQKMKIRAWGITKEEARNKLDATYPTASILWIKEL
jgi:hypothetical protein|tara:strand:+ start:334 stop:522 length:189 start_codon:yes stop_codon:yes gene_type:complete